MIPFPLYIMTGHTGKTRNIPACIKIWTRKSWVFPSFYGSDKTLFTTRYIYVIISKFVLYSSVRGCSLTQSCIDELHEDRWKYFNMTCHWPYLHVCVVCACACVGILTYMYGCVHFEQLYRCIFKYLEAFMYFS